MRTFLRRLLLGMLTFTIATAATARADQIAVDDLVTIVDNGYVRFTYNDGTRNYTGGVFLLDNLGTGSDFLTFCLERNESVKVGVPLKSIVGGTYRVASISGAATKGGFAGGNPDPLDARTQYLYFAFRNGLTAGWGAWTTADLQEAIWHIENELDGLTPGANAQSLIDHAALQAPGFDFQGQLVRAVTLMTDDTDAQDVLAITSVPEPGSLLLMAAGFAGLMLRRRA